MRRDGPRTKRRPVPTAMSLVSKDFLRQEMVHTNSSRRVGRPVLTDGNKARPCKRPFVETRAQARALHGPGPIFFTDTLAVTTRCEISLGTKGRSATETAIHATPRRTKAYLVW